MKQLSKLLATFRAGIVLAIVASVTVPAWATAVRPAPISKGHNGEILGGFSETGGPMGGRVYFGANFSDSSADGNSVVFTSTNPASAYDPDVTDVIFGPVSENVFLRNMRTGATRCLSCFPHMGLLKSWTGNSPRITPDGRYVVYSGLNLNDPAPFVTQIYRVDVLTDTVETMSVNTGGVQGNISSTAPVISDDGRYVAFFSQATNLVAGYPAVSSVQVFVRDRNTNQTLLASHTSASAAQPGNSPVELGQPLSISGNGRYVVWTSKASDYVSFITDNNTTTDVYFFDAFSAGMNIGLASGNATGLATGNSASFGGTVSANSASFPPKIVFASNAFDLHPADTNPGTDVYLYRGETTARLVSISRDGSAANAASSLVTSISRNARFVAFSSNASNLVTGLDEPTAASPDVFVRDLDTNVTRYASLNAAGQPCSTTAGAILGSQITLFNAKSNGYLNRNVSDDGRYVAFISAEPLSLRDNGSNPDFYVRDMTIGLSVLASLNRSLTGGQNGTIPNYAVTALATGGRKVLFTTFATNLTAADNTTVQNAKVYSANISLLASRSASDMDGDGKNNLTVFRPSEGSWFTLLDVAGSEYTTLAFGENGNRIAPGDYDGDGATDHGLFQPSIGRWEILNSLDGSFATAFFGTATDILAPADYDGDGRTDLAFFRPSNASFYIRQSNTGILRSVHFGLPGDIPVAGDYDGDNRADLAVFRPATGDWWILPSSTDSITGFHWGSLGDTPVTGDFDGDGRSDAAVIRNADWYILNSRDGSFRALPWGLNGDRPVVSDYDGDGRSDIAVFRPSANAWYILASSNDSLIAAGWGSAGDLAVPAAYVP